MEYGYFKRKDRGDSRERDSRDRGGDRDRGRGFREQRGGDRGGDFRDRDMEESVFSKRVRAGKRRTYFFDVRKTRGNDFFITITESTRREDGFGYRRHKIFLYKEDFNRFVASLNEVVNHVKTDLMPDFDYEEFDRRQAEWEAQNKDFEDDDDHFQKPRPERSEGARFARSNEDAPLDKEEAQHEDEGDGDDENDRKEPTNEDDEVSW